MIANIIGGLCVGGALICAANVAGMVAHYGVQPNGNPTEPHVLPLMFITVLLCAAAAFFFSTSRT
jgi:F0F1-type ATP synthase membrane subunit c/vacuolar-type H+-ATPase subunit K